MRPDPDAHRRERVQRGVLHRRADPRRPTWSVRCSGGWAVAMSLLGHERGEEAALNPIMFRPRVRPPRGPGAGEHGRIGDPVIREQLAWCFERRSRSMRCLGMRILTQYLHDGDLGPAASISKLYWSEYHQRRRPAWRCRSWGPTGSSPTAAAPPATCRTDDPGAPNSTASWAHVCMLNAASGTVYAGHLAGATQHPGREHARPPEGATGWFSSDRAGGGSAMRP